MASLVDPWADLDYVSPDPALSIAGDQRSPDWEMAVIMYAYGKAIGPFWPYVTLRAARTDAGLRQRLLEDALAALLAEGYVWDGDVLCKR